MTEDTREAILDATTELITEVMAANGIDEDDLASVQFTTTDDLVSEFPAVAARMSASLRPAPAHPDSSTVSGCSA